MANDISFDPVNGKVNGIAKCIANGISNDVSKGISNVIANEDGYIIIYLLLVHKEGIQFL